MVAHLTGKGDYRTVFVTLSQPRVLFSYAERLRADNNFGFYILTSGYRREESHFVAVSQRMVKTHQRLVDSSQQFAIFQRQRPAIALRSQMLA